MPAETLVDVKESGFLTSIEIRQTDESKTLDIFEKGIPNLKNLRKHMDIVLSIKSPKGNILYEMRQCDTNDFKKLSPALALSTIQKRLCPNLPETTTLKISGKESFSLQIRSKSPSDAVALNTVLEQIYFK